MAMFHAGLLKNHGTGGDATVMDRADWAERFRTLAHTTRDPRLKAYYLAGAPAGRTPLKEAPLLALDVETTGLDLARDEVVSIGVVPLSLDRIRASQARHWLLRPRAPLGHEAVTLHGITEQRVRRAPDLDQVLADVLAQMAGRVLVVHCREIERRFLDKAIRERTGEGIEFPTIDTMELEARLYRRPLPWWKRWFAAPATPVSIRLSPSRMRYGLPRYRMHHALTDALATAELFQAQVAHRFGPETPLSVLWH